MKVYLLSIVCLNVVSNSNGSQESNVKVLIDNDAGADDAMAVFLALLYERQYCGPKITGLTTTHGNVHEDQALKNNQIFLNIARRQEVPIFRGAKEALVHTIPPSGDYFGSDGLGEHNMTFTDLVPPENVTAVHALIEQSKTYQGDLVVIAIGPLTNIALAVKVDPDFLKRLKQLYVAGGHIHSDLHATPEYNAKMDVEAYKIVMDNSRPDLVTVLPYSQVEIFADISKEWRESVLGAIDTDTMKAMNIFETIALKNSEKWYALDPAMVACMFKEDLVEDIRYAKQSIITCGEDRGKTTIEFTDIENANVRLFYSIDKEAYKTFLIDVFSEKLIMQYCAATKLSSEILIFLTASLLLKRVL